MPALDPRLVQVMSETSFILRRTIPTHEIVEEFLVGELSFSLTQFQSAKSNGCEKQSLHAFSSLEGELFGLSGSVDEQGGAERHV